MRYFQRGTTRVHFVPAMAAIDAPTVAEITAGDDLSDDVADMSGWTFENSPIATPDLGSTFDKTIVGPDAAGDPTLTLYDDDAGSPYMASLAKGTAGYIVIAPYGLTGVGGAAAVGDEVEVWPVRSTGPNRMHGVGAEAARLSVRFAVTDEPDLTATVAA